MRDDLLDAQANVDWAVTQLPSLDNWISSWLQLNVNVLVENTEPPATHDVIVAIEKDPFPRTFNAEVGAYINAFRSSLDILATALADRYRIPRADQAYFPVARSFAEFCSGNYKGGKFVKSLPSAERIRIETLKPYQGGNDTLWALHYLDIVRKHRRLIDVEVRPSRLSISGLLPGAFAPIATGWVPVNEKTVLGLVRKGASHYDMEFAAYVLITEASPVAYGQIVPALNNFASLATAIIKLFDD
jgi:hypothetical protein